MIPLAKNIKRYFSFKEFVVVLLAIVISVSAGVAVFVNLKKEVAINDNGRQIVVKTMKTTVKEVFEQNGISVKSEDYVSLSKHEINSSLDAKLQKIGKNEIYIKRAVPINVEIDGKEVQLMTYRDTIGEALVSSSITLSGEDRVDGLTLSQKIEKDMKIKVIRVKTETVTESTNIPFKEINKENSSMDKGTQKTVREGKQGIRQKQFKVTFEDGVEKARNLFNDVIASNPLDRIVEFGTVLTYKTSRGDKVRFKKVMNMKATAYTASEEDTGKSPGDPGFGITYTGRVAREGVIAVDPRVIPLYSRVYVEVPGSDDYGYATALDIGSAIKGNVIDLYFNSKKTVSDWGRRKVNVYILLD